MEQKTQETNAVTPMKRRAAEAAAGFSAACLLTLALFPQPLAVAERVSMCLFAAAFPALIWARVEMEGDTQSLDELSLAFRLRFLGYLLATVAFALLLKAAYWPAALTFCITVLAVFIASMRAIHPKAIDKKTSSPASPADQATVAGNSQQSAG